MDEALRQAGFGGVEVVGEVIYARVRPEWPEFTCVAEGEGWQLAFAWPLRATGAQIAGWTAEHPEVPMDLHAGETRIRMRVDGAESLQHWAGMVAEMVARCTLWRRETRQRDEGM